jgi:hypothetical protein
VERLILRCFEVPPFPFDDREELIYPALFGFDPAPKVLWDNQSLLRVLSYSAHSVSSGLSEPWSRNPAPMYADSPAGAGYELVVKSSDSKVTNAFKNWVKYLDGGGDAIVPGNWLEYAEGKTIPETDIAGFLVVRPKEIPEAFPTGEGQVHWHQLIPVTATVLSEAKRTSVLRAAESVGY